MRFLLLCVHLLLSCTKSPPATGYHGRPPEVATELPDFQGVVSMDGAARTRADLIGKPAVVWFYPKAATGG